MSINGTVPPRRQTNAQRRDREYLTEREIERLVEVARKHARYGHRDATAILIAFRHGLRASELCDLQWGQINFQQGTLLVQRVKNGTPSTHYLNGTELRALRRLQRENEPGRYIFVTERGGPVTTAWFRKMFARLGETAKMPFPIHPHMLRHSCGFKFANEGKDTRSLQGYLGHRNIQSTTIYTDMAPDRFKGWERE
jgi:type 1 fimbriae regulatory protein FimB/type 1 fimbriae regulatory protein FimE